MTRRDGRDRREAWREYEILRLKMDIVLATHDHPPKGWDDALRSPDYLPPPGNEWPPTGRTADGRLIFGRLAQPLDSPNNSERRGQSEGQNNE